MSKPNTLSHKPSSQTFFDSLSSTERKRLANASFLRLAPRGKRKKLPEHILRAMAKPEHRDEVLPTLGLSDGEEGFAIVPFQEGYGNWRYYSRLKVEPTARCYVCKELFKLSAIRFHRPKTLGPEQPLCYFCYRQMRDENDLAAEPASRAARPSKRVGIGTEEKSWIVASVLEDATTGLPPSAIDSFIDYLTEPDEHGRVHIDLYFDKSHRFYAAEQLVEDLIDNIPTTPATALVVGDLEEVVFDLP